MKTGLGTGTISGTGISCGTDCNENFTGSPSVTLNVAVGGDSRFTAWGGDCAGVAVTPPATPSCTVPMDAMRSVRAHFDLLTPPPRLTHAQLTPEGIRAYLDPDGTNPAAPGRDVDTPAEFLAALPVDFKYNWILMGRSESLQTGTAHLPRYLIISADATQVFSFGLADPNDDYPAAHANAVEYMQFDPVAKNFRFHEIVLAPIPALGDVIDAGTGARRFPARSRSVVADDPKCFACHSTRNVINPVPGGTPGTAFPPLSGFKNKPNWDAYDSWGGMLPFNRDRIYKNSVEAAAFRKHFNLWTWQDNERVRAFIEQLELQPQGVPTGHRITRWETPPLAGGAIDGHIQLGFDPAPPTIEPEPQPTGTGPTISYSFDRRAGSGGSPARRDNTFLTLHHSCQPGSDEGRGVELFDLLTAGLAPVEPPAIAGSPECPRPATPPAGTLGPNPLRIADELIAHRTATGNVPIDVRPIALAIARGCISVSGGSDITSTQTVAGVPAATLGFFTARNGLSFNDLYDDTRRRAQSLPLRKADIEKKTLHRDGDPYVYDPDLGDGIVPIVNGIIREYGAGTLGIPGGTGGGDFSLERLRQEIFRRPPTGPGHPDETVMGRVYPDREDDATDGYPDNTAKVALFRYFLEPLGVSVDKWSMGVRGRSRTYTFADIFGSYPRAFNAELSASLGLAETSDCGPVNPLATAEFARLPSETGLPTYTDIQRILNKSCIECHGGLNYPPVKSYGVGLDFSEDDNPPPGERRLWRALRSVRSLTGVPACPPGSPICDLGTATDVSNSYLIQRITDNGLLAHPYNPAEPYDVSNPDNPADPDVADERCPEGLMPCGGPPLSKVDIETFRRWIIGGRPNTEGDPHLQTVEGAHYDFQSSGEFVLLRDEDMELQARQTPVTTAAPLSDLYTGLSSCVSVNTAVAMRVGSHRVTYQPEIPPKPKEFSAASNPQRQPHRLILRVDGKPVMLDGRAIPLTGGGRIVPTGVPEGIEVHYPGGTSVVITPWLWTSHQVWVMNINPYHARAVNGILGVIPPGNWLPALSDGTLLGRQPASLAQRHRDLYEKFADSWRVDSASSLFDYEPGLSPQSFVVEDWPVSDPHNCPAPPLPGGPAGSPPPAAPVAQAEAEELCGAIADSNRRGNCVLDVRATGERGFAGLYLATDKLERRPIPAPPVLVSPEDNSTQTARGVDFKWEAAPGTKGIGVRYRHCIWNGDEIFDYNRCEKPGGDEKFPYNLLPPTLFDGWVFIVCILFALILLIIAIVLFIRSRYRAAIIVLILALILLVFGLVLKRGHSGPTLATRVTDLKAGKVYFWKVVVETKDGIAIESKTRRFEAKE